MSSELTFFNSSARLLHSDTLKTILWEKDLCLSKNDLDLQLNSADPFPLLDEDSHSYPQAQAHSVQVDAWLGFQTEEIEQALLENQAPAIPESPVQAWI